MDGGNRDEEDRLGLGPYHQQNFPNQYQPNRLHHNYHPPDQSYLAPATFDPLPGHLPQTSYAATNAQAVAANAVLAADPYANSLDPASFYRNYPGAQFSEGALPGSASIDLMASTVSGNRQPPSLRSNGNGTTPRHPPVPSGRTAVRPAMRSASNPVEDRLGPGAAKGNPALSNGYSGVAITSVKDLKKRFDQSTGQHSNSRPSLSRSASKESSPLPNGRTPGSGGAQLSYSTLRSGTPTDGEGLMSTSSGTQRQRYVAEDVGSTNARSFASRINRPSASVSGNEQASKSMTHLPPQTSPRPAPPSPAASRSNGLLFGEILPDQSNAATVGYGIESFRPRSTSESNIPSPSLPQFPSRSTGEPEPSSPGDWYKGMSSPRRTNDQGQSSRIPPSHNRAHSDMSGPQTRHYINTTLQSPPITSSRLPLSIRKVASPPTPSSPVSQSSNSPPPSKRPPVGSRTPRQQHSALPTARAKTPTARAKTPTHATPTSSRKPPPGQIATPNNTRLNAYITHPPPKLSPPLRSSRPRQPVSAASTASSRMKAVDRAKSPHKSSSRQGSRSEESSSQRRKIDVGPIDFAQRRETIRLAYSKSIRETEAKAAARHAAAEKRRKAAEAAAKAKADAEAALAASVGAFPEDADHEQTLKLSTTTIILSPSDTRQSKSYDSPTLGIPGTFPSFGSPPLEQDEIPQSAISAASVVTEFDNEAQTEPPRAEITTSPATDLGIPQHLSYPHEKTEYRSPFELPVVEERESLSPEDTEADEDSSSHEKATYQYPFEEDDGEDDDIAVKISLNDSSPRKARSRPDFRPEPKVPGSFGDDLDSPEVDVQMVLKPSPKKKIQKSRYEPEPEYIPQPLRSDSFQTTVTILSREGFPDASPQMDSLEEFYVGPSMKENAAALRDSTFASSEFSDETPQTSAEMQRTPDTSNSLTIPPLLSPANRSSQQSGWTDFSIDSIDEQEQALREHAALNREPVIQSRRSTRRLEQRSEDLDQSIASLDAQYSPELSPSDEADLQSQYTTKHQLPELDTGGGFAISYLSEGAPAVPVLPDHEPPPVPTPDGRRTPSSSHYDQTRPSSYFRRESEDYVSFMTTPHSVDQMSIDIPPPSLGGFTLVDDESMAIDKDGSRESLSQEQQAPLAKERSRLNQRQNVIKELIDTEAVFVRDMNIVEEIYKGTAEACPQLDGKTIKLIFRNSDEIIQFHTSFIAQLKDGVSAVYTPKGRRTPQLKENADQPAASNGAPLNPTTSNTTNSNVSVELDDAKDRQTIIGPVFIANVDKMRAAHEGFLRSSDSAAKRLIQIQEDSAVKVWLNECNEVARDLTAAWNLDSLLIKPMQRITKYPNLISQLLQYTPADHPDRELLLTARTTLETAILEINKTKKNFELVGQIVGRKRKESDVRAGFARAFGKRVDKLQASSNRPIEDPDYLKMHEKFGDDYLRLQVVLRDVEYYTRQVSAYVHEFLQYLSAMELVMRLQPSPYPELESKWARFNVSMRDMEKVALDQHLAQVRKHVIEPFELVIRCYGNPSLAMKKRAKRRLDYEKAVQLKKGGKKVDKVLTELVDQYEALNDTLKKELPMLSNKTVEIGNICLGNFVNIQAKWFSIWRDKVKVVLEDSRTPEIAEIVTSFHREFHDMEEHVTGLGILNQTLKPRTSQSTTDEPSYRIRSRPSELSTRSRGLSVNSDIAPSLPTPDFAKRHSGHFVTSPVGPIPSPQQYYYRDYYGGLNLNGHTRGGSGSPITAEPSRSAATGSGRPSTGRSMDSSGAPRPSTDSNAPASTHQKRDSVSTYNSTYQGQENRRFSGLFHSALPLPDDTEENKKSSRASSRERVTASGYNILWLAASLFEFNIETTKHEAGYPYLTYQAGEIFDVIAEKGELWLAKNQDDPNELVGWIWSKHFAKLADS